MRKKACFATVSITAATLLAAMPALADDLRVAVASNFTAAIKNLSEHFEACTAHKVTLIFGSTGKHYAQIKNGAPFDVFLAADKHRPQLLEQQGMAAPGSRFTYALGKLVLWSPAASYVDPRGEVLERGAFRRLALANPKLAPYGRAAQEVLQARGLWDELASHLVRGENIGQTFQFVASGNAELGFVALSQIQQREAPMSGSFWEIPQALYTAIEQQAVLLKDSDAARAFLAFLKSEQARERIRHFGYATP